MVSTTDHFLNNVKLMKPIAGLLTVLLIVVASFAGSRLTNLSVTTEGRDIRISWEMIEQNGVQHFNVERRAIDQENFTRINDRPVPVGESRRYEFIDRTVYKQENVVVFYRIAIVEENGSVYYSDSVPLGQISNVVQRTWGSIKSLFR